MVCFQTKNPNLGKFWRILQWEMLVYSMDTWSISRSFVIFYGHLVKFVVIWYIFPGFGILYQEKYGNPEPNLIENRPKNVLSEMEIHKQCATCPLIKMSQSSCRFRVARAERR
jgi:hypothetical protein